MTFSKIIVFAGVLACLSPVAAFADAVAGCAADSKLCVQGDNLVGKRVTNYSDDMGGGNVTVDSFTPNGTQKITTILEPSSVNYDHGVTSQD